MGNALAEGMIMFETYTSSGHEEEIIELGKIESLRFALHELKWVWWSMNIYQILFRHRKGYSFRECCSHSKAILQDLKRGLR